MTDTGEIVRIGIGAFIGSVIGNALVDWWRSWRSRKNEKARGEKPRGFSEPANGENTGGTETADV